MNFRSYPDIMVIRRMIDVARRHAEVELEATTAPLAWSGDARQHSASSRVLPLDLSTGVTVRPAKPHPRRGQSVQSFTASVVAAVCYPLDRGVACCSQRHRARFPPLATRAHQQPARESRTRRASRPRPRGPQAVSAPNVPEQGWHQGCHQRSSEVLRGPERS